MSFNVWSKWYQFKSVYEFHGLIDLRKENNVSNKSIKIGEIEGPFHTDDGFRLRSKNRANSGSFKGLPLKEKISCPLEKDEIGVYCIKISHDRDTWYYIGRSYDDIHSRLKDHFRKLIGIPHRGSWGNTGNDGALVFKNWDELIKWSDERNNGRESKFRDLRDELRGRKIHTWSNAFFEEHVELAFVRVNPRFAEMGKGQVVTDATKEKITKIEGMALQSYIEKYKKIPSLNTIDETVGMEGFRGLFE